MVDVIVIIIAVFAVPSAVLVGVGLVVIEVFDTTIVIQPSLIIHKTKMLSNVSQSIVIQFKDLCCLHLQAASVVNVTNPFKVLPTLLYQCILKSVLAFKFLKLS